MSASIHDQKPQHVSISPLLKRLAYPATERRVEASEIASAFALIFEDGISHIQTAALLTLLHSTGLDRDAEVIAKCSHRMREAARQVDRPTLKAAIKSRGKKEGNYRGGLVSDAGYIVPQLDHTADVYVACSAISLVPVETCILPSTSPQPLRSLPPLSS